MSELLQRIKNEVAKDFGYNSYSELFDKKELSDSIIDAVATRYATEVAKNTLKEANDDLIYFLQYTEVDIDNDFVLSTEIRL